MFRQRLLILSPMHKSKKLIVIVGPTASGKTALAIKKASEFNTEIVSADSRQVYKELNIGVARPDSGQLSAAKHHLIAHRSIHEPYDVKTYETEALGCIQSIFKKSDYAVLAGGSGLYVNAVLFGLDDIPDVDIAIINELNKAWDKNPDLLLKELQANDPDYFRQVDANNPRRIIRALSVIRQTGMPFSNLRSGEKKEREFDFDIIKLLPEREELYLGIEQRVDQMILHGLEEEARQLHQYRSLKALDTVGYREWWPFFDGMVTRDDAIQKIKQHTRNYAKRQMTWWRKYLV